MDTLNVLNACLASAGELPLNAITDTHPMRFAALSLLQSVSEEIQARGRWYNMEDITLSPSLVDGRIYLPGDTISFRNDSRDIAQRGRVLYNLATGSPLFTQDVRGELIRLIPYDDLPTSGAAYIKAETVYRFQRSYDGDSTKTRDLSRERDQSKAWEETEHIRNRHANFLDSNRDIARLRSFTRRVRRITPDRFSGFDR